MALGRNTEQKHSKNVASIFMLLAARCHSLATRAEVLIVHHSCYCFIRHNQIGLASREISCNEGAGSGMHHTVLRRACAWLGGIIKYHVTTTYCAQHKH